jgi:hypothetical protein
MKKLTILALALLAVVAGCMRDAPTEPATAASSEPSLVQAPAEVVEEFVQVLDDVSGRLLPSLVDQNIATSLNAHLQELSAAMTARDREVARAALTRALELLAAYEASHGWGAPDAADLAGISLNLSTADALIGSDD